MYKEILKKGSVLVLTFMVAMFLAGSILSFIPTDIKVFENETKVLKLPLKEVTISVLPKKS